MLNDKEESAAMLIPSFFSITERNNENLKYFTKMFGAFRNTYYICHVKSLLLTIRVSFPRGQAVYVTTHLKATLGWFFIF